MVSDKSLWLEIDLPDSAAALPVESYCRTIADSRAYGSHWVLSLDNAMRSGMVSGDPQALSAWKSICAALSFFHDHSEWRAFEPMGVLAVVSDFRGKNSFVAGETLNLLNRRHVQFEILDRKRALGGPVTGLKAVLWTDDDQPTPRQRNALLAFIEQGGLLIAPKYWGPAGVVARREYWLPEHDIYDLRKGRIVVARDGFSDPFQLARNTHLLVGREHDLARLFNPGTTNCFTSIAPDSHKEIVQVVNYADRSASYLAVWVNFGVHGAKLWSPDSTTPISLRSVAESGGTSFELPAVPVNCAIEIERGMST
jgi:hypothetical protein